MSDEEFIELPFTKCEYKYSAFKAVKITKDLISKFSGTRCEFPAPGLAKEKLGITDDCASCKFSNSCQGSDLRLLGRIKVRLNDEVSAVYNIFPKLGDWVVVSANGYLEFMDDEDFFKNFILDSAEVDSDDTKR